MADFGFSREQAERIAKLLPNGKADFMRRHGVWHVIADVKLEGKFFPMPTGLCSLEEVRQMFPTIEIPEE